MARKGWGQLSANYRGRLEKAGISKRDYERGESIKAARGHSQTPERPTQAQNFPLYQADRAQLTHDVLQKKFMLFSTSPMWNGRRAAKRFRTNPPPMRDLRQWLKMTYEEWVNEIRTNAAAAAYLGYH
jgi:hypothetical protein